MRALSLTRPRQAAGLLLLVALSACGSVPDRRPLPNELLPMAQLPGLPDVRFWADGAFPDTGRLKEMSRDQLRERFPALFGKPHHYLAISGGGADGAFGAGLLNGWSDAGDRPEFSIVTGVSTGALSAPFAFLGPAYDDRLEEVYTQYATDDLVVERSLLSAVGGDSLYDTAPLRRLIADYMTIDVFEAIAREHRRGRRLYIATTDLDAMRAVIWDIGAIAASGAPDGLKLFHDLLMASAAIPIAFPPVYINVEARGERYDEVHVDGGTATQLFLYPLGVDWGEVLDLLEVPEKPTVYVIRNKRLMPTRAPMDSVGLPAITMRSMDSLFRTQGFGDLYRVYLAALRDGTRFQMASIPQDDSLQPEELFDPVYMRTLFDRAEAMARAGYPWQSTPPDFQAQ